MGGSPGPGAALPGTLCMTSSPKGQKGSCEGSAHTLCPMGFPSVAPMLSPEEQQDQAPPLRARLSGRRPKGARCPPPPRAAGSPGQRGPVLPAAGHAAGAASSAGPSHLCAPPPPPAQVGHLALISAARPAPRADLRPGAASEGWAPGPSPRSPPRSPPRPQTDCRADRRTDARWRGAGRRAAGGEGAGFLLRTSRTSSALGATSRRRCGPARGARAGGGTRGSGSG